MSEISRRSILQRSLAAGCAGIAPSGWAQPAGAEVLSGERAAMAAAARAFMDEYDVPGLSVAVARNGHLAYAQGFGVADTRTGETVTPAHLFRIASISKPITSVSIFSLVERARLKLTDKVFGAGGILSDFELPAKEFIGDITVAHLLTHAGGGWPNGPDDPMSSHKEMNHQQLIAWTFHNVPLTNRTGTAFIYSNFGYCVLGRVIEKIIRQDYAAYVRDPFWPEAASADASCRKHPRRPGGWRGRVLSSYARSLREKHDAKQLHRRMARERIGPRALCNPCRCLARRPAS